jgi:hypothetical protein
MTLPAYVDTAEEIPEGFEAHYVETEDGRFRLDAEGVEDIAGLKSALEKERAARKELKEKLDAATAREAASAENTDANDDDGSAPAAPTETVDMEAIPSSQDPLMPATTSAETADTESVAGLRAALELRLVESEAAAAVMAAKGVPELLLPIVTPRLAVEETDGHFTVRVLGEDGQPRLNAAGAPMTVLELVEEMRRSDVFGRAFEGRGISGSGAPPTGIGGGAGTVSLSDPASLGRHLVDIATGRMRVTGRYNF